MRTLLLFSNDLRVHDHPALNFVADSESLHCLYVVEAALFLPKDYQQPSLSAKRWVFLSEALADLNQSLNDFGQYLDVQHGDWIKSVEQTLQRLKIERLLLSRPTGFYERTRLKALLTKHPKLKIQLVDSYTLFEANQSDALNTQLPKHFTPFRKQVEQLSVMPPKAAVSDLPPPVEPATRFALPIKDANGDQDDMPAAHGGEQAALNHIHRYFQSHAPKDYKQTRNALSGWETSSKCSFWLSQGSLSCRTLWKATLDYESINGENEGTDWLRFELLWREYFQWLAHKQGAQLFAFQGSAKHPPLTSFYSQRFKAWCEGTTPYPLVNAIMKELRTTGYISNRARQIAASALVNELSVDWRYGAAWFEQHLLDYDVASNWGNWQYIAGVGADPRGGRHFNLEKQQAQFDPDHRYIKDWLGPNVDTSHSLDNVDAADWPIRS
jgi:deoxyribodipyrimidine photo-lyase